MGEFWLVVLGFVAISAATIVYAKRRAATAMARRYVDAAVPVPQALEVGVKASGSLLHRVAKTGGRLESMSGRAEVIPLGGGAHEWRVRSKDGVVIFQVVPHGGGSRVEGWADEVTIAQFGTTATGIFGLGFALGNALYRALGVPRNPGRLIRRRRRVFRAVLAAQGRAGAGVPAA
ncbi:MAG TPA: hypothetical protein VFV01_26865 [Spirillospora sp.]|nr:hypothetical protein [Spirillospora sp.]